MMVRSEIRDVVGLLDERYFMYGEDTDWSFRMKQAGWRIMYVPTTTVRHVKGASSRKDRPKAIRQFYRSMRVFLPPALPARLPALAQRDDPAGNARARADRAHR
jgi:GT2 family glycosyltransferase